MQQQMMPKLNTRATDAFTGVEVVVTHWQIEMGGHRSAVVRPVGTTPDGELIDAFHVEGTRLNGVEWIVEPPIEVGLLGCKIMHTVSCVAGYCRDHPARQRLPPFDCPAVRACQKQWPPQVHIGGDQRIHRSPAPGQDSGANRGRAQEHTKSLRISD